MDNPFAPLRAHESLFETTGVRDALARLDDGLGAREPFVLVTGVPGTGKSALVRAAVRRWGERAIAAYPALAALAGEELLEEIARRFGCDPPAGASRSKLVAELERMLAAVAAGGRVAVIVVDDAHDLPLERLEDLRLLVESVRRADGALEVVLAGLPALEERLEEPALAAVRQRVSVRVRLEPFRTHETRHYLHHRIAAAGGDGPGLFARRTCREVAALTQGVPRRVDVLAHESLRLARAAGQPAVAPEHVQAAAAALWGAGAAAAAGSGDGPDASRPAAPAPAAQAHPASAAHARPAPMPAPKASGVGAAAAASRPTAPHAASPPAASPRSGTPTALPGAKSPERPFDAPDSPPHPIPATHDAREWVQRFVGDRGPLQLSVRARTEGAGSPGSAGVPAAPEGGAAAPLPSWAVELAASAPARPRSRRRTRGIVASSLAAVVTLAVVLLAIRVSGIARRPAAPAANVAHEPAKAPATEPRPPAPAVVSRRQAVATVPAGSSAARTAAGGAGAAAPATGTGGSRPATDERYTVDVGGFMDLERAFEERDRIQVRTGIQSWVVPAPEGSGRLHRIVLGIYRSSDRAVSAADVLLANASVNEANVIPLPPRRQRR